LNHNQPKTIKGIKAGDEFKRVNCFITLSENCTPALIWPSHISISRLSQTIMKIITNAN